ncbi:Y-family DNA polymerase [Hyphococcus lacteus]|uniref:DNA-directed DNA polymerase n=1 Tax=Hyphococcus lacteus TaxID=3143536 RepID=A0ABV3Z4J1_9PROT
MRRVLSLWLPQLPLDRRVRIGDLRTEGPFAIIAEMKNAWRLTHVNRPARRAGIAEGLSLPDARAICPDLFVEPADEIRDAALLRALWRWADCLSPRVSIDPPDGLLLDISGCAHLFGGEGAMGRHTRQRLGDMQIHTRIGIADTKGAARALSRFGKTGVAIAAPGKTNEALKDLPIAALDAEGDIASELARTGLKTIGQLYSVKSSELARRFGLDLTRALGCTLGQEPDPLTPAAADPIYAARMTLPEPIGLKSQIEDVLKRLAASVCGRLEAEQKGARRYLLTVRCVDTGDHVLSVGFARPCAEPASVLQQFSHSLDQLKIEFGADWFRLVAEHVEPIHPKQSTLGKEAQEEDNTARIISMLGNRLGFDHVRKFQPCDAHLPEREFESMEAVDKEFDPVWKQAPRKRPLRLYKTPERLRALEPGRPPKQFEWRRKSYATKSAKGPERLTAEWWREGDMKTRDYWAVQTANGARLWLLTYPGEAEPNWYVAGKFP